MQNGGCNPTDGCQTGHRFKGADFQFLAANVVDKKTRKPIFPAYGIQKFGGVKVAFIGETLRGTPSIVSPSGIQSVDFLDEADTVRKLIPELHAKGVHAIVLLIHQGGAQAQNPPGNYDQCNGGLTGDILEIMARLPKEVDAVISGHTHNAYNCANVYGRTVTSASSFGRLYTEAHLLLNKNTGQVVSEDAHNKVVTRDVPPRAGHPQPRVAIRDAGRAAAEPRDRAHHRRSDDDHVRGRRIDDGRRDRGLAAGGDARCGGGVHEPGRRARRADSRPPSPTARPSRSSRSATSSRR